MVNTRPNQSVYGPQKLVCGVQRVFCALCREQEDDHPGGLDPLDSHRATNLHIIYSIYYMPHVPGIVSICKSIDRCCIHVADDLAESPIRRYTR